MADGKKGEMFRQNGEAFFVVDTHAHFWDGSLENILNRSGRRWSRSVLACRPKAPGQTTQRPARAPVEIVSSTWYRVVTEPLIPLFEKFLEKLD